MSVTRWCCQQFSMLNETEPLNIGSSRRLNIWFTGWRWYFYRTVRRRSWLTGVDVYDQDDPMCSEHGSLNDYEFWTDWISLNRRRILKDFIMLFTCITTLSHTDSDTAVNLKFHNASAWLTSPAWGRGRQCRDCGGDPTQGQVLRGRTWHLPPWTSPVTRHRTTTPGSTLHRPAISSVLLYRIARNSRVLENSSC